MEHAITLGDVLIVGGIGVGVLVLLAIGFGLLWLAGQGWNH